MKKKTLYVIIGGPQASGKSVAKKHLEETYENIVIFPESAQTILNNYRKKGIILGGALANIDFQKRILESDLERMKRIHKSREVVYVDESNLFTVAHVIVKNSKLADLFLAKYMQTLESFEVGIIFTDIAPDVSWKRRKQVYMKRYEGTPNFKDNMKHSKEYIFQLYPHLIELYDALPYPKQKIDGTVTFDDFKQSVESAFEKIYEEVDIEKNLFKNN